MNSVVLPNEFAEHYDTLVAYTWLLARDPDPGAADTNGGWRVAFALLTPVWLCEDTINPKRTLFLLFCDSMCVFLSCLCLSCGCCVCG